MSLRVPMCISALIACAMMTGCGGGSGYVVAEYESVEYSTAPLADSLDISMDAGSSVTTYAYASDDDGDAVSYVLIEAPAHGYLTFYPETGRFTYTPVAGFVGVDRFTYRAFDGEFYSNVAAVHIVVEAPRIIIVYV